MSSDPLPPAPLSAPAGGMTGFVIAQRATFGWVLVALGLLFATGGLYCAARWVNGPPGAAAKAAVTPDEDKDKPEVRPPDPRRTEVILGTIVGLMGAVAGLGVGGILVGGLPPATARGQLLDAREKILLAGGLFGLVFMAGGIGFFLVSFATLARWLDEKAPPAGAWEPVAALLAFLVGAGLAFLAAQPARAEERNHPLLRRLVYGLNVGLTTLLLLLLLVVGNVVAALRVPQRLDTTASGFYTLSPATRELIAGLDQPVTVYSTLPDDEGADTSAHLIRDARTLLTACQDANPARFKVRFLSPGSNRGEIARLAAKYPAFDRQALGVLLTVGEDEARSAFLRAEDLFTQEVEGRSQQYVFQGEAKLVRELLFLAENKTKPTVYFTQGSGELEVVPGAGRAGRGGGRRAATQLREALEKAYATVKVLEPDAADPKVPDDATVVVVADPQVPLPKEQADALRAYMLGGGPGAGGRKGKLVVLTSPHPTPGGGGVAETGLEPVLAGLGVRVGREYLLNQPAQGASFADAFLLVNPDLADARNPLAQAFESRVLVVPDCREVAPAGGAGGPYRAESLFVTLPRRRTWLEPDPPADPGRSLVETAQSRELSIARKMTLAPRSVGVLVSEEPPPGAKPGDRAAPTGRAAVYGSGAFFADPAGRRGAGAGVPAELLVATVDWLRDRPAAANIASKTYGRYVPKPEPDETRIFLLPVGATLIGLIALGLGVWAVRRT